MAKKLIDKVKSDLIERGLFPVYGEFSDKSSCWLEIYKSASKACKGKSIGGVGFNYEGTMIISIDFHKGIHSIDILKYYKNKK